MPDLLLAAITDDDYETRESATEALLRDASQSAEQLARWARDADDPEARWRLQWAASHHHARALIDRIGPVGQGALGISHRPIPRDVIAAATQGEGGGVLILGVLPGFDAMGKLRAGDIITAIDGQPIPDPDDPRGGDAFAQRVQRHPAGKTLELSLIREGRPTRASVMLVNNAALDGRFLNLPPFEPGQPAPPDLP